VRFACVQAQNELQSLYLSYAASDRAVAGLEALANVRRKHLTSAATWEGLAKLAGKAGISRTIGHA